MPADLTGQCILVVGKLLLPYRDAIPQCASANNSLLALVIVSVATPVQGVLTIQLYCSHEGQRVLVACSAA